MASATSAVTPAVTYSTGDLVNVAAAVPASEKYPGAVNPQQYGPGRQVQGPLSAPAPGSWGAAQFPATTPVAGSGGGVQDATWLEGHCAPQADWDSSAGEPFAPSGAVDPALHGQDLGSVNRHQSAVPAFIGALRRVTGVGQTWNKQYLFDPVQGQYVPGVNNRVDYDQQQMWDPAPGDGGGYAPWDPGYAERPVLLNVAYQATGVAPENSQYGVNGLLPDRSQWNAYQASAYEAPADPVVSQPAPPQQVPVTGGWLLR